MPSWVTEHGERYEPEGDTDIAQELFDKGLIWAINHSVLHREGYAIGVVTNEDDEDGNVISIFLIKVPETDPDGEIVFAASTGVAGYKKYLTAQHAKAGENA